MGMRFALESHKTAREQTVDTESVIMDITEVFPDDARLASVFFSWIKVHGNFVVIEKLAKLAVARAKKTWNTNPWLSMTAAWAMECGYYKWKKLIEKVQTPTYLYPEKMSESAITLKGAIPWLERLGFRIPVGSLRIRESDVLTPQELMRYNLQYRNRYIYGPSWRADIITAIQRGNTSPMAISRAVGCSYEPAHRISREYLMAMNAIKEEKEIKKRARKKKDNREHSRGNECTFPQTAAVIPECQLE